MKTEQQRIAIAEVCGWTQITKGSHLDNAHRIYGEPPAGFIMRVPANRGHACTELPDYLNDLNDMHEAEKVLTEGNQRWNYIDILHRQVGIQNKDEGIGCAYATTFATAAQRAEAFLRTLNLWVD